MLIVLMACKKNETIDAGNDPNFVIEANKDGILKSCNRKVQVFGIDIYAADKVDDAKLLHAANVMAQYLDNDEDGVVDNELVVNKMIENKAFVIMWKNKRDMWFSFPNGRLGQDLGNGETNPSFVNSGCTGSFDASLEEIWHIITHAGYAYAYPDVFGESAGTEISNAMDKARGGQYTDIPNSYPDDAWYTYTDKTCKYDCQTTEYFYWAMTSILGAQNNRSEEIGHEWKLHTKELVEEKDIDVYTLLTDPQYKLPTVLPDGTYKR
jgi:hypothetical protein